ncbi:MAG TPA: hypothetical protein VHI13_18770 [Candidatus Kapabacteria bacterium]|nr:hypothetical protein [Candidatus Kapabacteria bacterium]
MSIVINELVGNSKTKKMFSFAMELPTNSEKSSNEKDSERIYRPLDSVSRDEALAAAVSGKADLIIKAMLGIANFDADWKWAQDFCVSFANHSDPNVRMMVASALGDIARIHRRLDMDVVIPLVYAMFDDPDTETEARLAIDQFETSLGFNRKKEEKKRGIKKASWE